jgi:three-Cys-motif partner protein
MKQSFGGKWTEAKLDFVEKYARGYLTVMHRNERASHLTTTYIDGFAGSGLRYITDDPTEDVFEEMRDAEAQSFFRGSARRALDLNPVFGRYIFIETNRSYAEMLRRDLATEYPLLTSRVNVREGDCNRVLVDWARAVNPKDRAMVFLDPYEMQVRWATVEALAATGKVDLWCLVPLGQAVARLLTKRQPPASWARALTAFFGSEEWRTRFYRPSGQATLFGDVEESREADYEQISAYIVERFKSVFEGVLETPVVLRNSQNCPIYILCFAAANKQGSTTALRIASSITRKASNG